MSDFVAKTAGLAGESVKISEKTRPPCPRCAADHAIIACPYVKAVELAADGVTVARVEFLTPADYGPARALADPVGDDYPKLRPKP